MSQLLFLKLVKGCCFFISALLGWFIGQFNILNSEDKRNKNIAVICFVSINVIITILLGKVVMEFVPIWISWMQLTSPLIRSKLECLQEAS